MTVLTKALFHYHLLLNDCFFNQLSLIFYGMILVGKWRMHPFHMSFRFSSVYSWGCFFILFKYCAHYSVLSWNSKLYFRPDYLKQSLARSTHVDCFLWYMAKVAWVIVFKNFWPSIAATFTLDCWGWQYQSASICTGVPDNIVVMLGFCYMYGVGLILVHPSPKSPTIIGCIHTVY